MREYNVEIPVQPNVFAGIGSSTGDGLPDDYDFNGILRTRMSKGTAIPVGYLDFNVQAEDQINAIMSVLPIANRFVQFVALVYSCGFKIDMAGIKARRADGGLEASDYGHVARSPSNLDEMTLLWNQFDIMNDTEVNKNLFREALEWIYRGKTMINSYDTLLAYVTALEMLLDSKEACTVFKKCIPEEEVCQELEQKVDDVIKQYIKDDELRKRVVNRMRDTEVEGKAARWHSILKDTGISATKREITEIYRARSSTTHSGSSNALPINRAYEIATSYLKMLLSQQNKPISEKDSSIRNA